MLQLMSKMKSMTAKPLASYSNEPTTFAQSIVEIKPTKPQSITPSTMVHIPGGDFRFVVEGLEVQGTRETDADVQYPWEDSPRRFHDHVMHMDSFDIDKYPVTNMDFKAFIDATHYHPSDDRNFLKDWRDGTYLPGWEYKPVTWVSLEDARAYATWIGKRLPHEWEWQYAAQHAVQAFEPKQYPWGNLWRDEAVPLPDQGRTERGPDEVFAHPMGTSSLGVMDLVGNVWQWTDEYVDEHTRSAILRGGSYYQPQGSKWYFPQAYQNDQHDKLLLMSPGIDRAGTIGFRCVADSPATQK
jgi:formylglycine-generating enzyme required for sulfatase activity